MNDRERGMIGVARAPLLVAPSRGLMVMASTPIVVQAPSVVLPNGETNTCSANNHRHDVKQSVTCARCAGDGVDLIHPSSVVVVRGAIAGGKSTILHALEDFIEHGANMVVLQEPFNDFKDVGEKHENMLELYYADPPRWALAFQLYALSSRINAWRRAGVCFAARDTDNGPIVVVERSLEGDRVFAQVQRAHGNMNPIEYAVYEKAFEAACSLAPRMLADTTILMDTSLEQCTVRMDERSRSEEIGSDDDPGRAARLAAYYRDIWEATRDDIARIEADGRPVVRIPQDWSSTDKKKTATLTAIVRGIVHK